MMLFATSSHLLAAGEDSLSSQTRQTRSIMLPPETATFKTSVLPGYKLAQQKCSICHSADYINLQPPGMSLKQWAAEVGKMQHAYGAPINEEDIRLISEYLATTYGSAKLTEVSSQASTVQVSQHKSDAMTALANNACLSCHALNQKVIGPAYHDVAERYRDRPGALDIVMANIRSGGAGKWGNIPMPAFESLSEDDLKVLAEFVLKQ
jgi:cytochrome c